MKTYSVNVSKEQIARETAERVYQELVNLDWASLPESKYYHRGQTVVKVTVASPNPYQFEFNRTDPVWKVDVKDVREPDEILEMYQEQFREAQRLASELMTKSLDRLLKETLPDPASGMTEYAPNDLANVPIHLLTRSEVLNPELSRV